MPFSEPDHPTAVAERTVRPPSPSQPICSPTRSSLMTGRYTIRLGTHANVIYWDTPWGVPLNETFVAENLQRSGYRTAMFGKW